MTDVSRMETANLIITIFVSDIRNLNVRLCRSILIADGKLDRSTRRRSMAMLGLSKLDSIYKINRFDT